MIEHDKTPHVVVLLSGGVDSAACVAFYLRKGFHVKSVFIDYGQPARHLEQQAAVSIADHFGVPLRQVKVDGPVVPGSGLVAGRNALLVITTYTALAGFSGLLAIGIHAGTVYSDCSEEFVSACQVVIDFYESGKVVIAAPFATWSKGDVLEYARTVEVPVELTYSCEKGVMPPCGKCLSCLDLGRKA